MGEVLRLERPGMFRSALFSDDRIYRYTLTRVWRDDWPRVAFLLLNPSTADEKRDDPTIRRCIAFAKAWGMGGLEILNLFAYRSTDPSRLSKVPDPIGPLNLEYLAAVTASVPLTVCGWGRKAPFDVDLKVLAMLRRLGRPLFALKLNADNSPTHPLYLRGDLRPIPYTTCRTCATISPDGA
jgi:hypothetical protein